MLVVHYTGMTDAAAALDRLRDPAAGVSAHYLIDEDGAVYRLVAEAMRAWHAGRACWSGDTDVNDRSIGIELVNPGHELGYRPFPEPQMQALEALAGGIVARHPIPPHRVVGHSDVAPERKSDPGELFDWRRLAGSGVGLWPDAPDGPDPAARPDPAEAGRLLAAYGYRGRGGGAPDVHSVVAFQRHFRPRRIDGRIDGETLGLLRRLCARRAAAEERN